MVGGRVPYQNHNLAEVVVENRYYVKTLRNIKPKSNKAKVRVKNLNKLRIGLKNNLLGRIVFKRFKMCWF